MRFQKFPRGNRTGRAQLARRFMYQCEHCSASFRKYYSLQSHLNGNTFEGIPRCALIAKPSIAGGEQNDGSESQSEHAVITNPVDIQHEICRRHQDDSILCAPHPLSNLGSCSLSYTGSVDYGALVLAFAQYCRWVYKSRGQKFWSLFLSTRNLSTEE